MNSEASILLDRIRNLMFRFWRAVRKNEAPPCDELEACFQSFGLMGPMIELHTSHPNADFILRGLEYLEQSLMGVTP